MVPGYKKKDNPQPPPLTWQQVYDTLVMAGLSKRRASQIADWICARGVVAPVSNNANNAHAVAFACLVAANVVSWLT